MSGIEKDCGYVCGDTPPYGFVPEAGCPIHDPDMIELVKLRAVAEVARDAEEWIIALSDYVVTHPEEYSHFNFYNLREQLRETLEALDED